MRAGAQSFPPAWSSTATYAAGDIVQYGGNWYRAMKALSAHGPYPAAAYGEWELNFIRSNTTLTVGNGGAFPNLVYAWQFARNARIADAAYLHFTIATESKPFTENFSEPFSLDRDNGALVSISGDGYATVTFDFTKSAGFTIDTGHQFGTLANINVTGDGDTVSSPTGISATQGASIQTVSNVSLITFGIGIYANQNASLNLDSETYTNDCYFSIYADGAASVVAGGSTFMAGAAAGTGIYADHNSHVSDVQGLLQGTGSGVGCQAENGASVDISKAGVESWGKGALAEYSGHIVALNASFGDTTNNTTDVQVDNGGIAHVTGSFFQDTNSVGLNDGSYLYD